jgi:hypothetical protein
VALNAPQLRRLFSLLNEELARAAINGELYLVGGAVMCLAHAARPSTQDVDGYFRPALEVRQAAARVAVQARIQAEWLNDGVRGYLSERGDFAPFLQLSNLKILLAQPEYLLAMKCLAFRIGAEFHDEDDVRFLIRLLDIRTSTQAIQVISRYYPLERFPQKTMYALSELLPASEGG